MLVRSETKLFVCNERHWVPACAGTTLTGLEDYQSSSPACDDSRNFDSVSTTTVVPAQAGTQRLLLNTKNLLHQGQSIMKFSIKKIDIKIFRTLVCLPRDDA